MPSVWFSEALPCQTRQNAGQGSPHASQAKQTGFNPAAFGKLLGNKKMQKRRWQGFNIQ